MIDPPDVTVVTGAAGWLGRALVDHLAATTGRTRRPGRVRALVTDDADAAVLAALPRVDVVVGDVRRPDGDRRCSPGWPAPST